jgi:hypothetical protein
MRIHQGRPGPQTARWEPGRALRATASLAENAKMTGLCSPIYAIYQNSDLRRLRSLLIVAGNRGLQKS